MPDDTTIKATIATLTASGLDVNTTTVRGVCVVVVTDRPTGERYIHRDPDPCGCERSVQSHQWRWGSY